MTELRMRIESLQLEYSREHEKYSRERQELRTKLQQALSSQEVCSDPVNMPLPGLYTPASQSMMPNVTPMMTPAPPATTAAPVSLAPAGSVILDNVPGMMEAGVPTASATELASIAMNNPVTASVLPVPTAAAPPMTSSVAMTSTLTPLQYAAVLPGSRYQIQVNPDGSHQVIHVQQPPNVTVVTTTSAASSGSSTTGNGSYTTGSHPT